VIKTSYYYDALTMRRLRDLARALGYLQKRGVGAREQGSISAMLKDIAEGKLVVVERAQYERMRRLLDQFPNLV